MAVIDVQPVTRRLDADQLDAVVLDERVEHADGVGTTADTGDHRVGQAAFLLQDLFARFLADDRLEVADHFRVGVHAGGRADHVIGVVDIGDPVAQRLVHRVLQRAVAIGHRRDRGAQQAHAEDIGFLTLDVGGAHVDRARQIEAGADGGRSHAVLARAGFRDDAGAAHALGQQDLADAVVDLVRAGVVQLFALQVDLGAAEMLGQPLGEIERAGTTDIEGHQVAEFAPEGRILFRVTPRLGQFQHQRHQGLRDIETAKFAKPSLGIGQVIAVRPVFGVVHRNPLFISKYRR